MGGEATAQGQSVGAIGLVADCAALVDDMRITSLLEKLSYIFSTDQPVTNRGYGWLCVCV